MAESVLARAGNIMTMNYDERREHYLFVPLFFFFCEKFEK